MCRYGPDQGIRASGLICDHWYLLCPHGRSGDPAPFAALLLRLDGSDYLRVLEECVEEAAKL